jgi:uncharacterized repeat protein (TIGR01451 family)
MREVLAHRAKADTPPLVPRASALAEKGKVKMIRKNTHTLTVALVLGLALTLAIMVIRPVRASMNSGRHNSKVVAPTWAPPASMAYFTACNAGAVTIVDDVSSLPATSAGTLTFYEDTGTGQRGWYVGYSIKNNAASTSSDIWVKLDSFGVSARIKLAPNEDGIVHLGPLAAGETKQVYFYLYDAAGSGTTATLNETFQVNLYYGDPALTSEVCDFTDTINAVEDDISASANKVHTSVATSNPPYLGGVFTITVTGESGVLGSTQTFAMSPAIDSAWPAKSFQLTDVNLKFWGGTVCPNSTGGVPGTAPTTFDDKIVVTTPVGTNSCYQTVYTFIATDTTSINTTVLPVNHINSGGTNMKHTGTYSQTIAPVQPASNTTTLSKSASPTSLPVGYSPRTTTYTVTVSNAGAVDVSLDQFKDTLPAGASYVTNSSTFNGSSISEPIISGQVLTWTGAFTVPAGGSRTLVYQVSIPNSVGTYSNSVYGLIGTAQIDTTADTSNSAPATANVTVSLVADLAITNTDGVTTVNPGETVTYTIVITNNGPSPANNAVFTDPAATWINVTSVTCGSATGGAACPTVGNTTVALMQGAGIVIPTLPSGGSVTFTVNANISSSAAGNVVNIASIAPPSGTSDPSSSNNSATDTDTTTPLAAELSQFIARTVGSATPNSAPSSNGVLVQWQTGYEVGTLGFNVYRESNGQRVLLNPSPLAGSALLAGARAILTAGNTYTFTDKSGVPGTGYWLEEVELDGTRQWHGPVYASGHTRVSPYDTRRTVLLSQLNEGANRAEQLEYADTGSQASNHETGIVERAASEPAHLRLVNELITPPWMLPNQNAVKIAIRQDGWYRVTAAMLAAINFNTKVNAQLLQLYVGEVEVPLKVVASGGAGFEYLEFYGRALDTQATDTQIYWLTVGHTLGRRLETRSGGTTAQPTTQSFRTTVERKDRLIYFSGLLNGDAENWFGPVINATGTTQKLTTRSIATQVDPYVTLEVTLQGVTEGAHTINLQFNGRDLGNAVLANKQRVVARLTVPSTWVLEGDNEVRFSAVGGSSDVSLLESIRLNYARAYRADNDKLNFKLDPGATAVVTGFSSPNLRVLQLNDATNNQTVRPVREISVKAEWLNGSYGFRFQGEGGLYLALTDTRLERPAGLTLNLLSNWRANSNAADFIILTHRDFWNAANRLATRRRLYEMRVAVVDIEDVYDEFNYGVRSPQALKDMLVYARTNWLRKPDYALFIGDATNDPRNYLGAGNFDFVPTKLGGTYYFETALDNWFVDADNNGLPEIALGRLPVRTAAQADAVVAKILAYNPNVNTRSALLVSDRTAYGVNFKADSEQLANLLPPTMIKQFINRTDGTPDQTRNQIIDTVNLTNPLVVNWQGHGSTQVWTGDGLLRAQDASAFTNSSTGLYVMTTCLNGYFTDPTQLSLGEAMLINAPGGAFAVISSSALNQAYPQKIFNQVLYQSLFTKGMTLGQALTAARQAVTDSDVRNSYVLFGDPTQRFSLVLR